MIPGLHRYRAGLHDLTCPALRFAVISAVVGLAAIVLALFDPRTTALYPRCPFFEFTGWYCPGCGTTRALHALVQGHIAVAAVYNPLAVLTLPALVWGYVSLALEAFVGRPLPSIPRRAWVTWMFLAIVLAYWGFRNVPVYPFTLLAPGGAL